MAGEAYSRQSNSLNAGDIKAALQIRNEAKKRRITYLYSQIAQSGNLPRAHRQLNG